MEDYIYGDKDCIVLYIEGIDLYWEVEILY